MQDWKRGLLADAAIPVPAGLTFVPVDFESCSLADALVAAGFNPQVPAFFGWLGVVPYLTRDAFRSTITTVGSFSAGSGVSFDYGLAPEILSPARRLALANRVASAGEPFQLFFTPGEVERELRDAGFQSVEQCNSERLNQLYFLNRADGLRLPAEGLGMIATGWR